MKHTLFALAVVFTMLTSGCQTAPKGSCCGAHRAVTTTATCGTSACATKADATKKKTKGCCAALSATVKAKN